jgi:hypothetical protein
LIAMQDEFDAGEGGIFNLRFSIDDFWVRNKLSKTNV